MNPNKREILIALAALGAGVALPSAAQTVSLDLANGRAIGEAYRAAYPDEDLAAWRAELLPSGADDAALARLRAAAAEDFREGRVFTHQGWRLSHTEGRLFALLAA